MSKEYFYPKVLICVPVSEIAGVGRHICDIAMLGIPGFQLTFILGPGELSEELKKNGADVREINFGPEFGIWQSYKNLLSLIKNERPDIVHTHLAYADIVSIFAILSQRICKLFNKNIKIPKIISTEHGIAADDIIYHGSRMKSKIMELVHRARLFFTDGKIAVSYYNAEQMRKKWRATNVKVIPNGVDVEKIRKKVEYLRDKSNNNNNLRIVSMARLASEKKIDMLIDAFCLVLKEVPNAFLEISGKGPKEKELKEQVVNLDIESNVYFSGFNNPFEVLARNDILVQLSVAENNSYTLLEAKSAGINVVATAMGGNPEQLDKDELVPPLTKNNRSLIISEAAQKIIDFYKRRKIYSKDFTWPTRNQMVENISVYYKHIMLNS